eukprot:TRINITY_DN755_c0_g1_i1.p2 TRINITY_DN755_c0_g1~~TRINITY_DN755_c0_g1_i1.p2  ORF type:complete len:202 (-),score=63.88 TRINITY_DN755_c0_g1_i1:82-687(-)
MSLPHRNIILFGAPGVGKGTQSEKLVSKYGLVHLSTGEIFRHEVATGTDLGKRAKEIMDKGEFVPDEIVIEMIKGKIEANKHAKGFIFDGFPRTSAQAKALDDLLSQQLDSSITVVIELSVQPEVLIDRIKKRGKETGRSDDQDEEVIKKRIEEYKRKTQPIKKYYQAQRKLITLNGEGDSEKIFHQTCHILEGKRKRSKL